MLTSFKLRKKIFAISSLISLTLNILQPAFIAMAMAPVLSPTYAVAQEIPAVDPAPVVESTMPPSAEPSVAPSVVPTVAPSVEASVLQSATPEIIVTPTPVSSVLPSVDPSSSPDSTVVPSDLPLSSVVPSADSSPAPPSPISSPVMTDQNEQLQIVVVDNTVATSISEIDLTVTETGSAVLSTDKLDYAPTDTALITGAGFLPNTSYLLTISSTDDPSTSKTESVTTDEEGKLFYAYQLDGIYRPNYKAEAFLAGALVATVTFTDSNSSDADNYNKSHKTDICHYDNGQGGKWTDSNVDFYSIIKNSGHDDHSNDIIPSFVYKDHDNHNKTYSGKNLTHNFSGYTGQEILDNDCKVPTIATIIVRKITNPSSDTTTEFSITASGTNTITGNKIRNIKGGSSVNYEVKAGTYNIVESQVSGWATPSYSNCSGISIKSGETKTCTITNNKLGSITIIKNTVGADGKFSFTTTGGLGSFDLTTTNNTASRTFSNIASGTFSITESVPAGWSMSSNCTGTNGNPSSFSLPAGGNVICTFTNTKLPTLTVKKIVNSISPSESGKFNLKIDGTTYATNVGNNGTTGAREIPVGQHTVSETEGANTSLANYTSVIGGDCTSDGKITLSAGETKTCTITNTRKSGKILIDKILDSGDALPSLWDFWISGFNNPFKAGTKLNLVTGSYTITESNNIPGYSLKSVGGACSYTSGTSATLTVSETAGDTHNTCSFTNSRDTGSLRVNKQIDLNGDGDFRDDHEQNNSKANQLGFRWSLNSTAFDKQMGETIYDIPTSILNVVSYSVAEKEINGYHLAGWSLNGSCREPQTSTILVPITKNTTTTLTLCNVRDTGSITIIKDATPNSDEEFEFESSKFHDFELVDNGRDESNRDHDHHDEHDSNSKKFEDILTGEYEFEEESNDGWTLDYISCQGAEEYDVRGNKLAVDLQNDEDVVCTFNNFKNHFITLDKVTNPSGSKQSFAFELERVNDNYDERKSKDYDEEEEEREEDHYNNSIKFNLMDESKPKFVNTLGTGSFKLSESQVEGWETTDITCNGVDEYESDLTSSSVIFDADFADEVKCTFTNTAWGDLEVTKYNDLNGDGSWDRENEPTIEGVEIYLEGRGSQFTGEDGTTTFDNLVTDSYLLSEDLGEDSDWRQTTITCDDVSQESREYLEDNDSKWVYVYAGETTYCQIGNQERPNLTIKKSNDATGNKNGGDIVGYKLTLHLENSDLTNINVTDVTPEGFEYVAGSWSATLNGLPFTLLEPDYGSPGTWHIDSLEAGDTVELSYYAKIQDGVDAGTYQDTAWASGESESFGNSILAMGIESPFYDGIFVGTTVAVNKNYQQTGNVAIERQSGEVLGVSTEILPATGIDTGWLYLALGSLLAGLLFIFGGKMFKKSFIVIVVLASLISFAPPTLAADPDNNLSVRIEQPSSPIRINDWKLSYSVLDRAGLTPVVNCYVKKPGASLFTSFDVAHTSTKSSGDNASCKVDGGVVSAEGEYQFYITATSGANSESSDTVIVKYDTSGPGEPNYYNKEHPSSCKYIIKFHTADDDGATSKVEIYSSDSKTFDTNGGTRVGTVNIGSNEDGIFTHDRADNCDREWYYVIRAFDASGNQSSHRGDQVTISSTSSSSVKSPTAPALVLTRAAGSVLGNSVGAESREPSTDQTAEPASESTGEVLGEEKDLANKNTKYLWILLGVGIVAIIYAISRNKNMAR